MPAGSRILDAGAGELRYKPLCSHLEYVSQDFAQYNGQGDGVGLQMGNWDQTHLDIVCDITQIPEPDQSFDVIMCIEVFEHLPDPLAALREFNRLLKSGGWLIITAPFNSLTHFAPYHFYTGLTNIFIAHGCQPWVLKSWSWSQMVISLNIWRKKFGERRKSSVNILAFPKI